MTTWNLARPQRGERRRGSGMASMARGLAGMVMLVLLAGPLGAAPREKQLFDAAWRFHRGDPPAASDPAFDDSGWRTVDLPHDWSSEGMVDPKAPSGGAGGYFPTGIGWYRRRFTVPAAWRGRRVLVEFEGVYMDADIWLNGHDLGLHPYGYTSFFHDLTPYLKWGETNVLAVRVDNSHQPNCRWYTGSGIDRNVWLITIGPVHVAPWGVFVSTTAISPRSAEIRIETAVANDTDAAAPASIETRIVDAAGRTVATAAGPVAPGARGTTTSTCRLIIPHPQLWSPDTPILYRADTEVRVGGRITDAVSTPFGVRTVKVSAARGFELNGRPMKLDGGSVHADNGPLGAAAFARAEERRVALLKAAGFNAVRTAHNPPSPEFLAACDRRGLLVIDEAFDGWELHKTPHDYGTYFKEWWRRDLDAMVRRDRNHPSVVLWSIGNEVYERATPAGADLARRLADRIRELDSTRPITAGINGTRPAADWTKIDPLFASLDVAGYNYEIGRYAADHARLPSRVILSTESYQSATFAQWAAAREHPYVIGDFVWSAMDYLGEAGIGQVYPPGQTAEPHWIGSHFPWHGAYCGDLDLTGWRKPVSHYRAIVWDRGEKLYLAVEVPTSDGRPWNLTPWSVPPALPSWTWPGTEGRAVTVDVYSRYDAVRLYLNGRLLGEKPTTRAVEFKAEFRVPFAPGRL